MNKREVTKRDGFWAFASACTNRKGAEKEEDGIAVSHSTMYVNETIMKASTDIVQSFHIC